MRPALTLTIIVLALAPMVSFAGENAGPPKEVSDVLAFYAGDWTVEGTVGDTPYKGKASFRIPAGKHCIIGTVSVRLEGKPMDFSLVSGWDSSTGWLTEQGSGADGTVYRLPWRKVSPNVDEGELLGTLNGMKVTEKDRLERKGKDEFSVVCTERTEGEKKLPNMTFEYHRVIKEKAKKETKK